MDGFGTELSREEKRRICEEEKAGIKAREKIAISWRYRDERVD